MKITVMGPGGVGGYFGARLAAAGNDVTFVARGAHLEAMRKNGLRLDSEIGDLHLDPVKVVADAREIAAADAIIFAVKMRDTESAAREPAGAGRPRAPPSSRSRTAWRAPTRIGTIVGAGNVVEGAARIASHISEPGVIKQIGNFAILEFGEADGKHERAHEGVSRRLQGRRHQRHALRQHLAHLWTKFAMLAPLSGMTALTRGPIGPVRANAKSRALLRGRRGGDRGASAWR